MSILWSRSTIRPTAKNPDPERRRCMGIYKVKDRRGRRRYVVSKYWPNESGRLRMYAPNYRSAQALQTRIESSILDGTWKQLKQELAVGNRTIWTVHSFYKRFLEEYCKPRMRSWRSYEGSFKSLNAMLGNITLKEFQRKDLYRYVAQRKKQVKPATVNRAIANIELDVFSPESFTILRWGEGRHEVVTTVVAGQVRHPLSAQDALRS